MNDLKQQRQSSNIVNQIHELADVDKTAYVGNGTKVWRFTHVDKYAKVGDNCSIGQGCYIAGVIGDNCRIQNNVSVFNGVMLHSDVFIGPSVVFGNVLNPRATTIGEARHTLIKSGVTIGANSTIVCGVTLGEHCFVGAGSVVIRNVPPYAMVVGNPAHMIGYVCKCGKRLDGYGGKPGELCNDCRE